MTRSSPSSDSRLPLWILAVVALLFLLRAAKALFIPIAIAALISYALAPVVSWLERRRVPEMAGAALVLLVILGAAAGGAYALRDDARTLLDTLPQSVQRVRERVMAQLGPSANVVRQATTGSRSDAARGAGEGSGEQIAGDAPAGTLVQRGV